MAGFLEGTVKVPGISRPLPKAAVLAAVTVTGIGIYIYWRKQQGTPAAASAGTGTAAPDTTGAVPGSADAYPWDGTYGNPSDPYSQDPASGETYGDETGGAYYPPSAPAPGGGYGTLPGPPFSSNPAWSAYAIQQLTGEAEFNADTVVTALGLYLDGQVLDADDQSIVYAAQAVAGQVPVAGPGGYPPKLRTAAAGHKGGAAYAANPVKGLHAAGGKGSVKVTWDKSDHATGYLVALQNTTGHNSAGTVTVTGLAHTFTGLKDGDEFRVTVTAKPAAKGAASASATARTLAVKGKK
jgi:hypothetical protein